MRRYLIPCAGPVAAHGILGPKDEFRVPRLIVAATTFFAMTLILVPLARAARLGARQNITGTVKDALNRPLPDVQLKLQTGDGRILGRTRSSLSGTFEFGNVPAGTYAIQAKKNGFTQGIEIVAVPSQRALSLEIALQAETELSLRVATTRINPQPNGLSKTGNSQYTLTQHDIAALPQGANTPINEVLLQMPGVVQDTDAQIHVDGEHEDLQWRINGVMMPMDSFRDAGVLDMETKDGCSNPGGNVGFYGGQRETLQPSFEYGGCDGPLSYYYTGTFLHSNLAFSSATPGPTPIHNITNQGQGFGYFTYQLNPLNRLSLITGVSVNNSEVPNTPNLPPLFNLGGLNPANYPSSKINDSLDQDYYFGILALSGVIGPEINYQVAYTGAYSTIQFTPDPIGDLIYQGVASNSFRSGFDNTLQTDLSRQFDSHDFGSHNIGTGFYLGEYGIQVDSTTLAFPVDSSGTPTQDTPISIVQNNNNINMLYGVYLQDIWQVNEKFTATIGVRWDGVAGVINNNMVSPRS